MSKVANIAESGLVQRGNGTLKGLTINSHSSGTLKLSDGIEAGVVAVGTITQSVGAGGKAIHGGSTLTSTGASVPGTHAVSVLTGDAIVAGNLVVIGGRTYTYASAITTDASATACQVLVGSTLTISLANLAKAINNSGTPGLEYSFVGSKDPVVRAVSSDATTVTVRGIVPGTSLNTTATTGTALRTVWADTTLGGGTGASDAGVTTGAATVTLGSITYTTVDALSETYGAPAVAYQVLKGASEAVMLDNLKLAINGTGTAGTQYSTGTVVHPDFIATTNSDTTQVVLARTVGNTAFTAAINAAATTETMANTAWTGAAITNGVTAVATNAATITINGRVYTTVTALSETSGAAAVADQILWVTDEATFLDNLKKAINASGVAGTDYSTGTYQNYDVVATTNAATTQVIQSRKTGVVGNAITTTSAMTNYAWGAATLASGAGATSTVLFETMTFSAVATTGERYIALDDAEFTTGLYATIGGTANVTIMYE